MSKINCFKEYFRKKIKRLIKSSKTIIKSTYSSKTFLLIMVTSSTFTFFTHYFTCQITLYKFSKIQFWNFFPQGILWHSINWRPNNFLLLFGHIICNRLYVNREINISLKITIYSSFTKASTDITLRIIFMANLSNGM